MARGALKTDSVARQGIGEWPRNPVTVDMFDAKTGKPTRELNMFGKAGGSPERIAELEEIRKNSQVQEVVYRGQGAYESLGSGQWDTKWKKDQDGRVRGDWNHVTPDMRYASYYGGKLARPGYPQNTALIEGVLDSKKLLDVTGLHISTQYWPLDKGKSGINRMPQAEVLADILGKRGDKAFVAKMEKALDKRPITWTYEIFGIKPFMKELEKQGYDAVRYTDSGQDNQSSVAFKSGSQFKSYFGDSKVNQSSDNMFDSTREQKRTPRFPGWKPGAEFDKTRFLLDKIEYRTG
jgi:hypothetical protein